MTDHQPDQLPASPAQIATGLPVAADPAGTPCRQCGQLLRPGTPVIAILARPTKTASWRISAVACRGCPLTPPAHPAVLVAGTLTTCAQPRTQTHQLCLTAGTRQSHRSHASPIPTNVSDSNP